jgi:hypothetical protein
MRALRSRWLWVPVGALLLGIAWAAFAPLPAGSRDQRFEIPKGTWARRMAGAKIEILPSEIYLALGVRDILVLQNNDDVPQTFGPVLMMPGQSFRLPFGVASTYSFACTAHLSGQMSVVVDPEPTAGWPRLSWRVRTMMRSRSWS